MIKLKRVSVVVVGVLVLSVVVMPLSASAQGGGMPSGAGGKPGSPGMAGAGSFSMPEVPQPSVPQVSPPSFTPPSVNPPTFEASGRTRPSFTPSTGGERPSGSQRPGQGRSGEAGSSMPAWGSGYSPFSQTESGQWSRFGERGSGNITLGEIDPQGTLGWFDAGGFGSLTEPPSGGMPSNLGTLDPTWRPSETDLPAAPGAFDDVTAITEVQAQAQAAIENAGENRDQITAEAQQNIQQAADQAQQAYDQFWQDYYDAVNTTAQAYYDTVTATADALAQTYAEALTYTTAVIDYYLPYAEQFAYYCAYYPWDCTMYAYDLATGAYYYVGDTSDQPVAYVEIGDVTVNTTYPTVEATPVPSAEAYQAVTVFANDQLGAVIQPLYAGEATDQVQIAIQALPDEMEAFVLNAIPLGCADYWALLNGGVAGVMVGDCASGARAISSNALNAELSASSLGAYALYASAAVPTDAAGALALITQVYPALKGLAFAQITDLSTGLAFTATAAGLGTDPATGASLSVAKVVYAGVVDVNGVPLVYAVVGVGQPYVDVIASGQ